MRVLYDYQAFLQSHGGVSRYFAEVIRALNELPAYEPVLPAPFSDNIYLEEKRRFLTARPFKGKVRIMAALNRRAALRALAGEFDLFHPTYYRPYFLDRLRKPFILTVHDMNHERFSGGHLRDDGSACDKRVLCERAAQIIAVSQSTKDELCRMLPVPGEKVHVIHHATALRYNGQPRLHGNRYVLHVGERDGYKNWGALLNAFSMLEEEPGLDLLCVGGRGFTGQERDMIVRAGLRGRVHHADAALSDELATWYHFASVFCYPSLGEGFGIPLIEAFACGCPVAASSIPVFHEVADSAAEYFDPTEPQSMAETLEKILADGKRSAKLTKAGALRLGNFSWKTSAERTLEVYRKALA
jgi:glycosyltransferase involved in cell wall biosynthesis